MRILYFDVASIIILVILMISLVIRNMLDGRANRLLALVFFQGFLTAIVDLWAESFTVWITVTEANAGLRSLMCHLYFILRNLTPFLYQLFLFAVTDTWHLWTKKKWVKCILIIPYIIVCVTVISNPFNHMMFYFDENLVYHRGPLIYVLYAASLFYCVFGVVFLIVYKKMLTTEKFVALIAMYPLNLVAILIQLFFIKLLVEMFMTSLSFLLLTAVVQRPEENVNPVVGTRSLIAYTTDMKKAYYISKPIQIILVKIANYKSIAGILDIESCYILMKKLAEKMMKAKSEAHLPMDVYYLENGLFSLVTEKDQPDKLKAVAEQISGILSRATEFEKLDIELNSCICIIRCPEDIDNYEKLISFGNTFHTYLPLGGAVNDMSEPKDRRNLNLRNDLDGIISDAIVNKRFEMYYQPIYSINEKRFLSAEALIRLNDETYGFISPELFITALRRVE